MNTFIKTFGTFVIILLMISGCNFQGVQAEREEGAVPKAPTYQTVLGKPLNEKAVVDFIASNNCSLAGQFQLCKGIGMALWINSDQIVKTVWMYARSADGFKRYRGQLPYGLTFYDPMWRVEEKLSASDTDSLIPITGKELPDEASSPDHMHYWVTYKRWSLIVIYDTPGADEDAYIYAIIVNI